MSKDKRHQPVIPNQNKQSHIIAKHTSSSIQVKSSPVPDADDILKLKEAHPDFPKWIMEYTSKEQSIREKNYDRIIAQKTIEMKRETRNSIFAVVGMLLVIGLCGLLAFLGNTTAAATLGAVCLVAIVYGFLRIPYKTPKNEMSNLKNNLNNSE